jgi:hypothetical protein
LGATVAPNGTRAKEDNMGFIERELEKVRDALAKQQAPEIYCQLYAVQQALIWALEPQGFAAPFETIERGLVIPLRGTLEG